MAEIMCGSPSEGDLAVVERVKAEIAADSALTPRQRRWMKSRRMVERGEFAAEELELLCQCFRPDCVVHGTMPDRSPRLVALRKPQDSEEGR